MIKCSETSVSDVVNQIAMPRSNSLLDSSSLRAALCNDNGGVSTAQIHITCNVSTGSDEWRLRKSSPLGARVALAAEETTVGNTWEANKSLTKNLKNNPFF